MVANAIVIFQTTERPGRIQTSGKASGPTDNKANTIVVFVKYHGR